MRFSRYGGSGFRLGFRPMLGAFLGHLSLSWLFFLMLFERAGLVVMLRFAERARGIVELHNAAETAEGANALTNLGEIKQLQGDLPEAKRLLGRALAIRQRLLAPSDPLIAETLSDLALAERAESRFKTAAELYRRALDVLLAVHGQQ